MGNGLKFQEFFSGHAGNFTEHIDKSIPDYGNFRDALAQTLAKSFSTSTIVDVGASDGTLLRDVEIYTQDAGQQPPMNLINIDPNLEMFKAWCARHDGSSNVRYEVASFMESFYDDGRFVNSWTGQADVMTMLMVRQFVTPDASSWYRHARSHLGPNGVFVYAAKVSGWLQEEDEQWLENDKRLQEYKQQHFTAEEIATKGSAVVDQMYTLTATRERQALSTAFNHVFPIWANGANFVAWVASNNIIQLERFSHRFSKLYYPPQ